jgi:hypothetical protein
MDYVAEINEIESELNDLKVDVKSATGVREELLNQRILGMEKTRLDLYKHVLQQNTG